MLRSVKEITGYTIVVNDGEIGKVHDFLFDDMSFAIRYLVADTRKWLPGRKVLVPPGALEKPDWAGRLLPVDLTRKQVEESPPVAMDEPVSRQQVADVSEYFGWKPDRWTGGGTPVTEGPTPPRPAFEADEGEAVGQVRDKVGALDASPQDPHLRSVREVTGYHVQAKDDQVGHIEDLIVDDRSWHLRYAVVDTRNWLPGKRVLVATGWIESVMWGKERVLIDLTSESIKNGPAYDPNQPINRETEEVLYDFHGRPHYWG